MRTIMFTLLLLIGVMPSMADDEFASWESSTGEIDGFMEGSPIDVTTESSTVQLVYRDLAECLASSGDIMTGLFFHGYNPGKEQVRSLKVWLSGRAGKYAEPVCVYDGECMIPRGGTAEEYIPLVSINFDAPYEYHFTNELNVKLECTGEQEDCPVFFACQSGQPVVTFVMSAKVKHFSGIVTGQDGCAVGGACVTLSSNYKMADCSAVSSSDGHYSVRVERSNLHYVLSVTAPGYARYVADIPFLLRDTPRYGDLIPPGEITLFNKLEFFAGQQATIILPDAPDPSWGRYYKPVRKEEDRCCVIFERELEPQANVPYIIFPEQDFTIDVGCYDWEQLPEAGNAVVLDDIEPNKTWGLYGTYQSCYVWMTAIGRNTLLDFTPDCIPGTPDSPPRVGAFRAYLMARDAIINSDEARLVFVDEQTGIDDVVSRRSDEAGVFDLQGRRLKNAYGKGVYIRYGKKYIVK